MKKNMILSAAVLFSATVFADDFNLYYDSSAGNTGIKIESVANLQKITFEDGKMVAFTADGKTQTLNTADIKRLFFSTEKTAGIEGIEEGVAGERVHEVYDLTGRKINVDPQTGALPKGMYIINGKKILVK